MGEHTIKSLDDYFADWETNAFGFGYGTGEAHVLPALKTFLAACPIEGGYDYEVLENAVTPAVAWLLINRLCHLDVFEYGTSPRYAWLTPQGRRLKQFVDANDVDYLYELAAGRDENYVVCYPDACNCGETGYEPGRKCPNPFWTEKLSC